MSALSIPLMISKGIKEEMAMNVFVAGSILSIVNDIVGGWLSEQCTCRLGSVDLLSSTIRLLSLLHWEFYTQVNILRRV